MLNSRLREIAAIHHGKTEPLEFQTGLQVTLDRSHWHSFFLQLHGEEIFKPCHLRMLSAKNCSFGVTIFAELFFSNESGRFVVSCDLSLADTLATIRDIWPYADWMEQEIFELYGARINGVDKIKRLLIRDL